MATIVSFRLGWASRGSGEIVFVCVFAQFVVYRSRLKIMPNGIVISRLSFKKFDGEAMDREGL